MNNRTHHFSRSLAGRSSMLGALLLLALPLSGNSSCATTGGARGDKGDTPDAVFASTLSVLEDSEANGRTPDYKKLFDGFASACAMGEEQGKPHAKACYNAGHAADKLGRSRDAAGYYRQALAADPGLKSAAQNLTVAMLNSGDIESTLPIYEEYLASNPTDVDMLNNYAGALGEAGRHEDGVLQIQKLLYKDPKNTKAYKTLARIYFLKGSYRMSQMASGNALKLDDKDADIHNNIALTFLKQGKEAEAVVAFKKALELDETNLEANMNLGLIAVRAADYETAGGCFNKVLKQQPGNAEARIGLAVAYRGTLEHDSALEEYDSVLASNGCDKMALRNKAMVQFLFQKKYKDTLKTYADYSRCHPDDDVSELTAKVQYEIEEQDRMERELAELERQMAELERQAKEKAKVLTAEIDRSRKVFVKYAHIEQDPEFKVYLEDYIGNLQFAIDSEDPFFMDEALQAMDEFMVYYYSALIDLNTGESLADPEEWTSRQPIEVPVEDAPPAEGEGTTGDGETTTEEAGAEPAPATDEGEAVAEPAEEESTE